MTREEAIELARKAGHPQPGMDGLFFQRLVNLAVAAEREACAKACEAEAAIQKESAKFCKVSIDQRDFSICAAAIRARGQS